MKLYIREVLIGADRLLNAILRGSADETLSSRAYRMHCEKQPYWGWLAGFINALFFWRPSHCENAWKYEASRWNPQIVDDTAGLPYPIRDGVPRA